MFVLTDNNKKEFGTFDTIEKAYEKIREYLESIGFKAYYYRQSFLEDNSIWIDYGSHTHFFYINELQ
jgi:hypothetical protein